MSLWPFGKCRVCIEKDRQIELLKNQVDRLLFMMNVPPDLDTQEPAEKPQSPEQFGEEPEENGEALTKHGDLQ